MGRFSNIEFEVHDPDAAEPEPAVKPKPTRKVKARIKGDPQPAFREPSLPTVGRSFVFTGKLLRMSRSLASKHVATLGGVTKSSVTKDLDYLVVGDAGSPLYSQGKKGGKILAAERLIAQGYNVKIISETTFFGLESK